MATWRGLLIGLVALLAFTAGPAYAHKSSDAYMFIEPDGTGSRLRWDIALRDLDAALPLDADGDRQLTWGEVKAGWPAVDALATAGLSAPGCSFAVTGHGLERRVDGAYAVLHLATACRLQADLLRYALFTDIDPTHRGILKLRDAGGVESVHVLVPSVAAAKESTGAQVSFLREGVHHILTGYDHLLFLLCLLLPAVLRREDGRWTAAMGWRATLWPVVRTVTLFTLAHSVTLALATLGWVRLPPWFVEPAIAVTIMLAALDNIRPLVARGRAAITFLFGLIHGFGFAGVLGELQLPASAFGWALFQFNLGLELGQLAMVLLVVPMLYLIRGSRLYVPGVMVTGSVAAMVLAAAWLVERTSDVSLLPF